MPKQLTKLSFELEESVNEVRFVPEALKHLPGIELDPGINLIAGNNGSGKSTLLEALWLATKKPNINERKLISKYLPDAMYLQLALSVDVAQAVTLHNFDLNEDTRKPLTSINHFDFTASATDDHWRGGGSFGLLAGSSGFGKSQRESRESRLAEAQKTWGNRAIPSLLFIDEPEHGLDPWRHRNIKAMVGSLAASGSLIVVATNSPILVGDETLPRIDLRKPSAGITYNIK